MLSAVETFFRAAIEPALPAGVTLRAGPSIGPSTGVTRLVEVSAERLLPMAFESNDFTAARGPAYVSQIHRFTGDGVTSDFLLPPGVDGTIVEVETPPGRMLRREDAYTIDDRTIRFYKPPAAEVVVTLRGSRAKGFVEKRFADVQWKLRAFSDTPSDADALHSTAMVAVLAASVDLGHIEGTMPPNSVVRMRLKQPAMAIVETQRTRIVVDDEQFFCSNTEFLLRGELELTVAIGVPEPTSLIEHVQGTVHIIRPNHQDVTNT